MKFILNLLLLATLPFLSLAQTETYDLKNPNPDINKNCQRCFQTLQSKPAEVQFGVQMDEAGEVYFILTDPAWFDKIFQKGSDGLAIDVIKRSQYLCSRKNSGGTWLSKGKLLPPMYQKDLRKNSFLTEHGYLVIRAANVPADLRRGEIELNIVFIQDKYPCYNNNLINLQTYKWDLLDMGMYMDTIAYGNDFIRKDSSTFHVLSKRLKFVVPFEKNKYEFSPADVRPIYDSLNLTDYNISSIHIRAYSSIEGPENKNIELQQKRAQSIAAALQSYQTPSISVKIEASENWVEFLNDISSGPYASLANLTKEEIKVKLEDKQFSNVLEPYLKNHRKAILLIELEKKNELKKLSGEQLLQLFDESIANKNLKKAKEIQEAVFDKIKDEQLEPVFLSKMEIPRQNEYGILLNNATAFSNLMYTTEVYESYLAFRELEDIFPQDGRIKYNIVALKFRIWVGVKGHEIDPVKFKSEIEGLKKYKIIDPVLIARMMLNYHIIMGELHMSQGRYADKDKSVKYIYDNYYKASLRSPDLLSLAQYFSAYVKYDWAVKMLDPHVNKIDVDEELLFYYINITIASRQITQRAEYRKIMLNAVNINRKRYCTMFTSSLKEGVSFQLLDDEFLKKTYCENCQGGE